MHKIAILLLILDNGAWAAGGLKVLHAFGTGLNAGSSLYAGPILDALGNVYGAAESGGTYDDGIVYKLSPGSGGAWTETVLYNFKGAKRNQDGANPHATLMADSAGNLYGTTVSGGIANSTCKAGCGTVFMLTPAAGTWQETVLYRFTGGTDGYVPYAGVAMDTAGNLYGATTAGGLYGSGAVYKLTPGSSGWEQTVLYSFPGHPGGSAPYATPFLDASGNLYGTTNAGGSHNLGLVYELALQSDGTWKYQVLHTFVGGTDGANPFAGVIVDHHGNVYGTTSIGGAANCGIAFALVPNQSGGWTEHLLHTFLGIASQDGENPNGLTFGPQGSELYGTSMGGGVDNPGTIFKITHTTSGWQETVLYSFTGGNDGAYPISSVVLDAAGNLFGTTLWGGPAGDTVGGVAYRFTP